MTAITYFGAIFSSLVVKFLPQLRAWFEAQSPARKQLIMLTAVFASVVFDYAGVCAGWWMGTASCDWSGATQVVVNLIEIVVAAALGVAVNQGMHFGTKQLFSR